MPESLPSNRDEPSWKIGPFIEEREAHVRHDHTEQQAALSSLPFVEGSREAGLGAELPSQPT